MNKSQFLDAISNIRDYWLNLDVELEDGESETKYKMDGLIFSILVMFDGESGVNDCIPIKLVDNQGVINNGGELLHDQWCYQEQKKQLDKEIN